ncbi:imelysin family protein [Vibrio maerlii]|uniref:imelysin family protein n=1 Tax=Vibrio maerlii TaxID=2231648 RepID=UPI000E3C95BC|nr:imelysin family protein [Vibrio maerlii]
MNKIHLIALSCSAALVGCQSNDGKNTAVADGFEQTNHQSQAVYELQYHAAAQLEANAEQLNSAINGYCEQKASLTDVQARWQQAMHSWMALQGQERGPTEALDKSWAIQFWPDKKNTTGRKVSQLLATEADWAQQGLSSQSVAVQGLGAVEWMLYDDDSPLIQGDLKDGCGLALAMTQEVMINTQAIETAWQINPWKDIDDKQWNAELVSLLSNQLEYALKKMERPLAKVGQPRPYFAESWRSKTSLANIKYNIAAAQRLYLTSGSATSLDATLRASGHDQLADSITDQFELALLTWPQEQGLFDLLQTKEGYQLTMAQYNKLEQLKYLIHEEAALALGVVVGFNATDGD